ncbi:hypothetical protein LWF01_10390 [Saxibacter everestensis]|uniref:General stress protein 17M-like domain-containing protein n=1 Tax=Saxibacter everestensis TaxID=2909229 RepID=A0ABY8QQ63_9MICO|nr:hypothetical protein LWF01_10390 [Brevibacteriaceae bacterium ZFBP1038]
MGIRPTPPKGEVIASYENYLDAQRVVSYLADEDFTVEHVSIVGIDLKLVESVTGKMSYAKAAASGAASGAWFGLLIGLLLSLFGGDSQGMNVILAGLLFGAGFGIFFGVIAFSLTRRSRDFTSTSQVMASSYQVVCATDAAQQARSLIERMPSAQ